MIREAFNFIICLFFDFFNLDLSYDSYSLVGVSVGEGELVRYCLLV